MAVTILALKIKTHVTEDMTADLHIHTVKTLHFLNLQLSQKLVAQTVLTQFLKVQVTMK